MFVGVLMCRMLVGEGILMKVMLCRLWGVFFRMWVIVGVVVLFLVSMIELVVFGVYFVFLCVLMLMLWWGLMRYSFCLIVVWFVYSDVGLVSLGLRCSMKLMFIFVLLFVLSCSFWIE